MKKIIYILVFIIVSPLNTFSQNNDTIRENYIGITGGLTIHSIVTDTDYLYDGFFDPPGDTVKTSFFYQNGWTAGISYKNFTERLVGLAIELNYVKKGGINVFLKDLDENKLDTTVVLFRHNLEYIELPFLMNLRFGKRKLKLNLYGGANLSYLLKENITFLSDSYGKLYKSGADLKFEFGLNGGGGLSYQFGKSIVEIGLRYSHGLTNIFKYESINSAVFNQNQVISTRLNYFFIF